MRKAKKFPKNGQINNVILLRILALCVKLAQAACAEEIFAGE